MDWVLPELLEDYTDVVADAELIKEFIRATHAFTVYERESVCTCICECVHTGGGGGGGVGSIRYYHKH